MQRIIHQTDSAWLPMKYCRPCGGRPLFFLGLSPIQIFVLSITGGCFVTLGALFSLLLSMGVQTYGPQLLLQGLGFSGGFFMIVLLRAVLFTEADVLLPAIFLQGDTIGIFPKAMRFWGLAWLGNMLDAYILGRVLGFARFYPAACSLAFEEGVSKKMCYMAAEGWCHGPAPHCGVRYAWQWLDRDGGFFRDRVECVDYFNGEKE